MENELPLISVIVPVYKVEQYLDECVSSIVNQTYKDLEIILIDDGSPDNCPQMCDEWAKKDDRIIVIHQENGGAASARNTGLEIMKGEYLTFVDSDDFLDKKMIEELYKSLIKNNGECSICGLKMVDYSKDTIFIQSKDKITCLKGIDAIKERYIDNINDLNIVSPCGKLFKKSMWYNLKFTNGLYYEDLDLMPYLYVKCEKIVAIPYIGYYYLQRNDSASHSGGTDDKRVIDSIKIREKHIGFYQSINENELIFKSIEFLLDIIITSKRNGWIPAKCTKYYNSLYKKHCNIWFLNKCKGIKSKLKYLIYYFI